MKIIGTFVEASFVFAFEAEAQTLRQANSMATAYWHDSSGIYQKYQVAGKPLSKDYRASNIATSAHIIRGKDVNLIHCVCR